MPRKRKYEETVNITLSIPKEAKEKLEKIRFYTASYSQSESFVEAVDIANDVLEKKFLRSRPGVVNGKRNV